MKVALSIGSAGLALTFLSGIKILHWDPSTILFVAVLSNLSVLVSMIATLSLENIPTLKRVWFRGMPIAWLTLLFFYFGLCLLTCPPLRDVRSYSVVFFPLLLSTGLVIPIFGIIQDQIVRSRQRKQEAQGTKRRSRKFIEFLFSR